MYPKGGASVGDGYHCAKHKRWREAVLRRAGYLCEECKRYGRVDEGGNPIAATVAHHIRPVEEAPELRYDRRNGRALCAACHNKYHPEKAWKK